jgi:hypothetical protein
MMRPVSAFGPSRHFAAPQQYGRFLSEADINSVYRPRCSRPGITMGLSKLS